MTRISICMFGATVLFLTSNTFACDWVRSCRSSCRPVVHVTAVSNGSTCCTNRCPPVACVTAVDNGCGCVSYQQGEAYPQGGVYEIDGGYEHHGGSEIEGSHDNGGTNESPLDPDIMTRRNGEHVQLVSKPEGQQIVYTERKWTDASGQHQRLARFDRMEGTTVILKNAEGRTSRIDIQHLSDADQRLVNQLSTTSTSELLPEPRIAERT